MKFIRRLLTIMVSLCALFGTAGCNHGTTSSSDSTGGSSSEPAQTGNYIAYDGSSDYTILLPESPQPAESTAATELSTILGQVTGATIDVVAENRARDVSTEGNFISVGETQLYKEQEFKAENLNTDGFLIKTVDNTLFIIGENQRGTLYGVYEFLEREAGCRFLSPTYDHIPSVQRLGLRELDITEIPTFATRSDFYWPMSYDTLYTAKMRYLSQFSGFKDLSESIGGSLTTYWNETGHSYYQFVPHTTYYAQHPDWFSGPDANNSQPCFSSGLNNDGTIAEGESFMSTLIEAVKQKILDEPMLTHIMLGQMDNDNVCRCERCTAQIEALGGQRSAQLVLVTNAVAREVKEWMQEEGMDRDMVFLTFSYWWSMNAPTRTDENGNVVAASEYVIPRDDVYIFFAPIGACYNHPINDTSCSKNVIDIYGQFENWRAITDRFYVWDYAVNFNDYLSWYPNLGVLKENLLYYREIGVAGVLTEGAITAQNYYEQDLTSWLLSKLMWDLDQDVNELRAEYDRYYFGEAAGPIITEYTDFMNAYFERVSRTQSNTVLHAAIYTNHTPWMVSVDTLNEKMIDTAQGYIDRAEAAINGDDSLTTAQKEQYLYNLKQVEVQIMYMKYRNYDAVFYTTDEARYEFMTEFFDLVEELDVNALSENGQSIADLRAAALEG